VSDPALNGLRFKDISDWVKIAVLLAGIIIGYVKLSDQVSGHTGQIQEVNQKLDTMKSDNETRNRRMQQEVGAIKMYLCSKDNQHCSADSLAPTQ
jgi:hypothetical protein